MANNTNIQAQFEHIEEYLKKVQSLVNTQEEFRETVQREHASLSTELPRTLVDNIHESTLEILKKEGVATPHVQTSTRKIKRFRQFA